MSKHLKELEKRLKSEPHNLGLKVMVAGMLRDSGRSTEAVELYRSVALAYRDQGRKQQAIAVCRSVLEIASDDVGCVALIAQLTTPPPPEPSARRSSMEETPLPHAVPHHVYDPTDKNQRVDIDDLDTHPDTQRPRTPTNVGLAEAARKITGLIAPARPRPTDDEAVTKPGSTDEDELTAPRDRIERGD